MSEIHGATGSYVLNALDPSEVDEFEAHLAVCPTCSREVVEFCETAAELSLLASAPPPPALKGSIMSAIGGVRVLPPLPAPLPVTEDPPAPPSSPAGLVTAPAPVDELALRRQRRLTRVLSLAVAAAMVVALALGGWVVNLVQQRDAQIAASSAETQLYGAPDVKVTQFTLTNGAQASFVASRSLGRALFTSTSLPSPGGDRVYQLWTLRGDQATPDNLVPGGNGIRQWFRGDIAGSSNVALSIEPAGGSPQPTDIQKVAEV